MTTNSSATSAKNATPDLYRKRMRVNICKLRTRTMRNLLFARHARRHSRIVTNSSYTIDRIPAKNPLSVLYAVAASQCHRISKNIWTRTAARRIIHAQYAINSSRLSDHWSFTQFVIISRRPKSSARPVTKLSLTNHISRCICCTTQVCRDFFKRNFSTKTSILQERKTSRARSATANTTNHHTSNVTFRTFM